jgi:plasmid stabilization system protein ParE
MDVELIIAPEAASDLAEAHDWYESQCVGRGEDLLIRVDACINAVLKFPEMHALFHANYRRALIRKYPDAVFYEYDGRRVTVYAVFHTSRDPEKWRRRLP